MSPVPLALTSILEVGGSFNFHFIHWGNRPRRLGSMVLASKEWRPEPVARCRLLLTQALPWTSWWELEVPGKETSRASPGSRVWRMSSFPEPRLWIRDTQAAMRWTGRVLRVGLQTRGDAVEGLGTLLCGRRTVTEEPPPGQASRASGDSLSGCGLAQPCPWSVCVACCHSLPKARQPGPSGAGRQLCKTGQRLGVGRTPATRQRANSQRPKGGVCTSGRCGGCSLWGSSG